MQTGKGLGVIIDCELTSHHSWMAFAAWYSLSKGLPDAEVLLSIHRGLPSANFYHWAPKCQIRAVQYLESPPTLDQPRIIHIEPTTLMVRDWNEEMLGPTPAKSSLQTTFVDCSECGLFVASEWIHKEVTPFSRAKNRFATEDMSVNELAVLKLWEKCVVLYDRL